MILTTWPPEPFTQPRVHDNDSTNIIPGHLPAYYIILIVTKKDIITSKFSVDFYANLDDNIVDFIPEVIRNESNRFTQ
jgi:hypothetical protein